jgi:hypothetical protein
MVSSRLIIISRRSPHSQPRGIERGGAGSAAHRFVPAPGFPSSDRQSRSEEPDANVVSSAACRRRGCGARARARRWRHREGASRRYAPGIAVTSNFASRWPSIVRLLRPAGGRPVGAGTPLRNGDLGERVERLAARLRSTGDLESLRMLPASFDSELEDAVRRFQERHGLDVDGIVGPATTRALDVPVDANELMTSC